MDYYILIGKNPVKVDDWLSAARWQGMHHNKLSVTVIEPRKPLNKGNRRMLTLINRKRAQSYLVSTVFLGMDHNWYGGEPLLFETMVFSNGDWGDLYCRRYSNYDDAITGHNKAVNLTKAKGF